MPTAEEYDENKKLSEAELRAKLGAQPDEEPAIGSRSPAGGAVAAASRAQRNPYPVALTVITSISALVAVISLIVSVAATDMYGAPDLVTRAAAAIFGGTWLGFALLFLIATLIVGGITWKPRSDDN